MASKIFLALLGIILSLGLPIYIASANDNLVRIVVQKLMQQGKTLYQAEQFADAASNFKQVARVYELQGDLINQALALNYVSLTKQKLGDWNGASEAVSSERLCGLQSINK